MAGDLIVPDQLPRWVPGQLTVHSPDVGWDGVSVRGYRYAGSDVEVPPIRDYMIVAYLRGKTLSTRRAAAGRGPGVVPPQLPTAAGRSPRHRMRIAGTTSNSTTMITRRPRNGGHEYVPLLAHRPMLAAVVEALAQGPELPEVAVP
jgi:hypothetical protein